MTLNFFTSSSFNACLTTIGIIDNVLVQQSYWEGRKFHNHLGQELNVYKLLHELFAEVLLCMSWICQGAEGAIGVSEQHNIIVFDDSAEELQYSQGSST